MKQAIEIGKLYNSLGLVLTPSLLASMPYVVKVLEVAFCGLQLYQIHGISLRYQILCPYNISFDKGLITLHTDQSHCTITLHTDTHSSEKCPPKQCIAI